MALLEPFESLDRLGLDGVPALEHLLHIGLVDLLPRHEGLAARVLLVLVLLLLQAIPDGHDRGNTRLARWPASTLLLHKAEALRGWRPSSFVDQCTAQPRVSVLTQAIEAAIDPHVSDKQRMMIILHPRLAPVPGVVMRFRSIHLGFVPRCLDGVP